MAAEDFTITVLSKATPRIAEANRVTTPQTLAQAVRRVWRRHPRGYGFLAARRDELWIERGFRINDSDGAEDFFVKYWWRRWDLILLSQQFQSTAPSRHVSPCQRRTRTATSTWAIQRRSTRRRLFWSRHRRRDSKPYGSIATTVEPKVAESLSRSLSLNGDKGGWSITKMLRVPGTLELQRLRMILPLVSVVDDTGTPIAAWPAVQPEGTKEPGSRKPSEEPAPADYDAALARFNACLRAHEPSPTRQMWLRKRLLRTRDQFHTPDGPDRSFIITPGS